MQYADDRAEVHDLLVRYATAIDTSDWDLFRTVFTDDCHLDYGTIGVWHGPDEVTEYMRTTHATMGATLHRVSNIAADFDHDADPRTARSTAYVDVLLLTDGGRGRALSAIGTYADELVRTGAGWKVSRRKFTMVRQTMLS